MFKERAQRTLLKTISWRTLGTVLTMALVYTLTGKQEVAVIFGGTELVVKSLAYYLHERAWDNVKQGRFALSTVDAAPFVVWFTGLPSAGKSTLAENLNKELMRLGVATKQLDGDTVRKLLANNDFSREGRIAHLKQMGALAAEFEEHGVPVIASFVSPYRESRDYVRSICRNFIEVYVATPASECEARDVKGLYAKARSGELKGLTGIDGEYEPPLKAEIEINTQGRSVSDCVTQIVNYLAAHNFVIAAKLRETSATKQSA